MVFIPIRKLSNESNEEMLTKEHAHGQQVLYTLTRVSQVIWMKFHNEKITIKLVNNRSFTTTQQKLSPSSVESREIMTDIFLNIGKLYCRLLFSKKVDTLLFVYICRWLCSSQKLQGHYLQLLNFFKKC